MSDCYRGYNGAHCTKGDMMRASHCENSRSGDFGGLGNMFNAARCGDAKADCLPEHITGRCEDSQWHEGIRYDTDGTQHGSSNYSGNRG